MSCAAGRRRRRCCERRQARNFSERVSSFGAKCAFLTTRVAFRKAAMSYTDIPGGITAAQGFLAGSVYCGIKAANKDRPDLALIHSPQETVAAGTFTTNRV